MSEKARLEKVLENSWLIPQQMLQRVQPGSEEELLEFLRSDHNPLLERTEDDIENPHIHLLRIMRDPDWFPFTCKHVFGITITPMQHVILKEMWVRPFPMLVATRGGGKSFLLSLYSVLRAFLCQGKKICIVGAAFRQSKVVFEYCESIWANAPVLRDLVGSGKGRNNRNNGPRRDIDRCELVIGDSVIIALPLGDGKKIRGQRAQIIIADEFASIPPDIYENVVAGFAAVSQDPVKQVQMAARTQLLKQLGIYKPETLPAAKTLTGNQAILAGTAYYDFNWFATYWKRYKAIIESKGDKSKLAEFSPDGIVDDTLNWRDYSIIRIPVDLLPEGFMDAKHIARSRATVHNGIFQMEFGACFATDSQGFFKRSLIESCVCGRKDNPITGPQSGEIVYHVSLMGERNVKHMFAIDPASENDNFSIVILGLYPDHRRIVFCWTTTRSAHRRKFKAGAVKEHDFYGYCARKIRELMRLFPCVHIAMDGQGGGIAVEEALRDIERLEDGELPIYPVIDEAKPKDSDNMVGEHILEIVQFARGDWVAEANHGLRKDLEDKVLVFPYFDPASIALAIQEDEDAARTFETLEDAVMEVEELKDELATIIHTQTSGGRDHWDTPAIKVAGGRTGRMRKDRYSALLMANMAARNFNKRPAKLKYKTVGGWAKLSHHRGSNAGEDLYIGPAWFKQKSGATGRAIKRCN